MITSGFLILVFAALIVQLVFQLFIRSGLKKIEIELEAVQDVNVPISVIIVARNEEFNLKNNLPTVLASNYSNFQVVLVDDHSSDGTKALMDQFAAADDRIKVIVNKSDVAGKKLALTAGIEAASNECLVFTDADCTVNKGWLAEYASAFASGHEFIIGHGAYERGNSWFSEFYAFEAHKSAMLYFASAAHSNPYMCVGRSMGYTKSVFEKASGFKQHPYIQSGSDDLFLQSAKSFAKIDLKPRAVSYSKSPSNIHRWMVQRKRHLGAGKYYSFSALALIFLYELSNMLTPLAYLFLLFSKSQHLPLITLLLIIRIALFRSNAQVFSRLVKSTDDISQLWWTEYPMSWLNALISMNIGLMKKEAWTTRR